MLSSKPLKITNQRGYVMPGRQRLFKKLSPNSTSGANDRDDVNSTLLQPFASYNLGGGLAVGAVMEASANWEAEETWTVPLIFNVSKVALLGKQPVNFQVGAGPMVVSPSGGANWRFRFQATFMFPR